MQLVVLDGNKKRGSGATVSLRNSIIQASFLKSDREVVDVKVQKS